MKLKEQRELLIAAIYRNEEQLAKLGRESGTDCPCCFGAAYGGVGGLYMELENKLERQYAWLEIVNKKLGL